MGRTLDNNVLATEITKKLIKEICKREKKRFGQIKSRKDTDGFRAQAVFQSGRL